MLDLVGQVALITGAARGQGRSHALALAREGVDVIALDSCGDGSSLPYPLASPQDLEETADLVAQLGRRVVTAQVDVRDLAGMSAAVDRAVAELGRLDIVLANAGVCAPAPTLTMTEEQWDETLDVNLTGVWKTLAASVRHLKSGGRGGAIVITSSMAGLTANAKTAHYSASKAGLVGLMRVLARELGPDGISVNTVHPATVATDMVLNDSTYRLFSPGLEGPTRVDFEQVVESIAPMPGGLLDVQDVTDLVMFLVRSRAVTGTTQQIDRGAQLL